MTAHRPHIAKEGMVFQIDDQPWLIVEIRQALKSIVFENAAGLPKHMPFGEFSRGLRSSDILLESSCISKIDYSQRRKDEINLLPPRYLDVLTDRLKFVKAALADLDDGVLWDSIIEKLEGCVFRTVTGRTRPIKKRTLQEYVSRYRKELEWGLVPGTYRSGNRSKRFDDLYEQTAYEIIEEDFMTHDRWKISYLQTVVAAEYKSRCKELGKKPGPFGRKCLDRILSRYVHAEIIQGRVDRRTARKLLRMAIKKINDLRILERLELDCFTLPIFVVNPLRGQPPIRPVGCAIIDVATSFPLALVITVGSQNGRLIRNTLLSTLREQGDEFFNKHDIGEFYRTELFGKGHQLFMDHATENFSKEVLCVGSYLSYDFYWCAPGMPEKKPFIERFIGEVEAYVRTLPGGIDSEVEEDAKRTESAQLEASLSLEELDTKMQQWRYAFYCEKPNERLSYRFGESCNPRQAVERLSDYLSLILVPSPADIKRASVIFEDDTCTLQHYGVKFKGEVYSDSGDGEFRALYEDLGQGAEVRVAFHPDDAREIAVFKEYGNEPIFLANKNIYATTFEEGKAIRRAMRTSPEAELAEFNLAQLLRGGTEPDKQPGKRISTKDAKKAARDAARRDEIMANSRQDPMIRRVSEQDDDHARQATITEPRRRRTEPAPAPSEAVNR
ncbi:MAG: hypothetical protein RH946_03680 [Rhodospirillales bacterium]